MISWLAVTSGGLARHLRTADWLDRSRLLGYAAILGAFEIAALAFWLLGAHGNLDPTGKPLGTDFLSFWSASHLALNGSPASAYVPEIHGATEAAQVGGLNVGYFSFFYPPVFLLACLPLALLPYGAALGLWLAATLVPYGLALWRLLPRLGLAELAACFTFPAILLNAGHGQNGFLSAALMAFGFLLLRSRPILAGVLLGALVFKPQLAVLVPFILAFSGRWRAFLAAGSSAALLVLLSWLVFGTATWTAFVTNLLLARQTLAEGFVEPGKMVSIFAALRLLHAPQEIAVGVQLAASAGMLVLSARLAPRASPSLLAALCVTATLLATPFALDYDLTLLAIPLAVLLHAGRDNGFLPYEKLLLGLGFALPLAARPLAIGLGLPVAPLVILGLLWLTANRIRQTKRPAEAGL